MKINDLINLIFPDGLPGFIGNPGYSLLFLILLIAAVFILQGAIKGLSSFLEKTIQENPFRPSLAILSFLVISVAYFFHHYWTLTLGILMLVSVVLLHYLNPLVARRPRNCTIQIVLIIGVLILSEAVENYLEKQRAKATKAYVSLMFENSQEYKGLEESDLRELSRDFRNTLEAVFSETIVIEPDDYPTDNVEVWWTRKELGKRYSPESGLPRIILCNTVNTCQADVLVVSLLTKPVLLEKYDRQCSAGEFIVDRGGEKDIKYLSLHMAYQMFAKWGGNPVLGLDEQTRQRIRRNIVKQLIAVTLDNGWEDLRQDAENILKEGRITDNVLIELFHRAESKLPTCNSEIERQRQSSFKKIGKQLK